MRRSQLKETARAGPIASARRALSLYLQTIQLTSNWKSSLQTPGHIPRNRNRSFSRYSRLCSQRRASSPICDTARWSSYLAFLDTQTSSYCFMEQRAGVRSATTANEVPGYVIWQNVCSARFSATRSTSQSAARGTSLGDLVRGYTQPPAAVKPTIMLLATPLPNSAQCSSTASSSATLTTGSTMRSTWPSLQMDTTLLLANLAAI